MKFNPEDLIYKTYTNSSPSIKMTITHIPTGTWVSGSGQNEFRLKQELLKQLEERLADDS